MNGAPQPGLPEEIAPGVRRILAPNPSPMTYWGTNTYLVGSSDLAVIDPGPDDSDHLQAILGALRPGESISHILVTHSHLDHSPLAARLAAETGAPILAYGTHLRGRSPVMEALAQSGLAGGGEGIDTDFTFDQQLEDGEVIAGSDWQLRALWTPGHIANHLCFAMEARGLLFSGDHVMGWASSLVSPPDGDLTAFMASCRRLAACSGDQLYLPGHGAPIAAPAERLDWLITHRETREAQIRQELAKGPATAATLTQAIYTDVAPALLPAAERNVLAHLIDLTGRDMAEPKGALSATSVFHAR